MYGAVPSHGLLDWLTEPETIRGAALSTRSGSQSRAGSATPSAWPRARRGPRRSDTDGGNMTELTGLLELDTWPAGMRAIIRRERPTPARNCRC